MNPELDKIASAAIDGEASPEELARLGSDPAFLAAKTELAVAADAVAHSPNLQAPPGLAKAQISLAMEEFKAVAAQRALIAAQPTETSKSTTANTAKVSKPRFAFPSWFGPAFLSVAVLAGLGLAANNFGNLGSEDASSAPTADGGDLQNSLANDSSTEGELMEDAGAAQDDIRSAAAPTTSAAAEANSDETSINSVFATPATIDLTGSNFLAQKGLTAYRVAELATSTPPLDPALYERCGPEHGFEAPPGELELVVPFSYDSVPAEVLVYDTGEPGGRTALILNDSCEVLSES